MLHQKSTKERGIEKKSKNPRCWAGLHHRGSVCSELGHIVIKIVQGLWRSNLDAVLYNGRAIVFSSIWDSRRLRTSRSTEVGVSLAVVDCMVGLT